MPVVRSIEPEQSGERRVVLQRPGGATAYIHMAYHVPQAAHADLAPLLVLDGVLCGFSGPAPFDGGGGGRSSRLYRALVDGGLTADVGSGLVPSIDPTVFRVSATVRSGVDVENVEQVIDDEITRIHERPVDGAELASVKRQARSQFVYLNDGVSRRAVTLGAFATVASPETLFSLSDAVDAVTAEDVTRVARTYLIKKRRTVGWFVPAQDTDRRETQE
jgi:zinc protease